MSMETLEWLNRNILIGFTDKRGKAWHYQASEQGAEPNHYSGPIPVEDIERRLFDFEMMESPLYIPIGDTFAEIPNRKAMVTSDTREVLGIFSGDSGSGKGYQGHQYRPWLIDGPAKIVSSGKGEIEPGSAGLLRNRGVAFVTLEVPENITTPEGVDFRPHLIATTSFDGTLATTYKRAVRLPVCDNTLSMALGEAGQVFKVKHTRYSNLKLSDARDALAIVFQMAEDFTAEVRALTATKVSDADWTRLLDVTVPLTIDNEPKTGKALTMAETKRGDLNQLWQYDGRVAPWTGTAFGVLQAFNTYGAHLSIVRGRGHEANRVERNYLNDISGKREAADNEVMAALASILEPA